VQRKQPGTFPRTQPLSFLPIIFGIQACKTFINKVNHTLRNNNMPSGKKRKRHMMATHKRKKRLRKDRHKKKK
jgi:hypothetical protein